MARDDVRRRAIACHPWGNLVAVASFEDTIIIYDIARACWCSQRLSHASQHLVSVMAWEPLQLARCAGVALGAPRATIVMRPRPVQARRRLRLVRVHLESHLRRGARRWADRIWRPPERRARASGGRPDRLPLLVALWHSARHRFAAAPGSRRLEHGDERELTAVVQERRRLPRGELVSQWAPRGGGRRARCLAGVGCGNLALGDMVVSPWRLRVGGLE